MMGVFLTKLQLFYRRLWIFGLLVIGSIVFALIIGSGNLGTVKVPIYTNDDQVKELQLVNEIEESDVYMFQWMTEQEAQEKIKEGKAEFIVELNRSDYRVLVNLDSHHIELIDQLLSNVYVKQAQTNYLSEALEVNQEDVSETLNEQQLFHMTELDFNEEPFEPVNPMYQPLFGFTLFFVIYTIAYNVFYILIERVDGIWDRMMLSPIKKWEVYVANLAYSFIVGCIQVVIVFAMFYYVLSLDFNGNFLTILIFSMPYVFTIVSLAILITSIVKTVQQFNAVIPLIAISMAMLGGAYWPLDIVENNVMLLLARFMPITYGMEILNGVALYNKPISELMFPVSVLLLMGVLFAGIGIHLMERKHV